MKVLAAGGGVVTVTSQWLKPVVDSVVLPAHAKTSGAVYSGTGLRDSAQNFDRSDHLVARLVNKMVPPANAQAKGTFYACAVLGGATAEVAVAGLDNASIPSGVLVIRRGTLPLPPPQGSGATGSIVAQGSDVGSPCDNPEKTQPRQARIVSCDETEIVIQILTDCGESAGSQCEPGRFLDLVVPRAASCLPEPTVYTGPCNP